MLWNSVSIVGGIVALYFGAEWLVRGASRLARRLGISPLVVGLTVVAFGTSAPEMVVSILSAGRGASDVAVGNVVGSNILNIALILGLSAAITPLRVEFSLVRREIPVMIAALAGVWAVAWDGEIGRFDGGVLVAAFAAFTWMVIRLARREPVAIDEEYREFEDASGLSPAGEPMARNLLLVGAGLGGLVVGAHLFVEAAVAFARTFGVPELVVGLTIVAIGTSLPELATSIVAALRREADIAVANVVGSNIFNALLILGSAALVRPLAVNPDLLRVDIPVSVVLGVVLVPFAVTRASIERWEGIALLAVYAAFTAFLLVRAAG